MDGKVGTRFIFERLEVYQKALNLVSGVYSLTQKYPKEEMFGLVSQFRRAAVSICLNIADGSAKTGKDFCRFLDMARGSVFECVTILHISVNQKYISQSESNDVECYLVEISKMLSGLQTSARRRLRQAAC
jgi:four helix bundle protein